MIPKTIHYCWLSGGPLPPQMQSFLDGWRAKLPGWKFVRWDSERAPAVPWVEKCIAGRRWAFAADYIRLYALWSEGGVYLDLDVEVVSPFEDLLDRPLLLGREGGGGGTLEAAVIGAEKGNALIRSALDSFGDELSEETLPVRLGRVWTEDVLKGVAILPSDYLSPKDWRTGRLAVTENTRTIHHFAGTWLSRKERVAAWCGRRLGNWAVPVVRWIWHRFERTTR